MPDHPDRYRFYGDLAPWWPLISPPDDYKEEAAWTVTVLQRAAIPVKEVLELGSGGGHNAVHLKAHFTMTLADLSPEMLGLSRALNPECDHILGDMRDLRLGRDFDAVFIHDAIDYMITEGDLRRTLDTAFAHCRPGGIAVLMPDDTAEMFEPSTEHGGEDGPDGRGIRYLAWSWDPDPEDTWIATDYAFILRDAEGGTQLAHETHRTGLFEAKRWIALMVEAGFRAEAIVEETDDDRTPRLIFLGHRAL